MHDDQPTAPGSPPDGPHGPGRNPGGNPAWPERSERAYPAYSPDQRSSRSRIPVLLGASLGANVALLVGVVALLLLGRAGFLNSSVPTAPSSSGSTSLVALGSPTATASPPAQAGWLQAAPGSVTLGCGDDQRRQFMVLINTGPQPVQWQAALSLSQDQAAVTVSPNQGTLKPGASMPLQIQSQSPAEGAQGSATQQGVLSFMPLALVAGSAPSVRYTAMSCS